MGLCCSGLMTEVYRIPMRWQKLCFFVMNGLTAKDQILVKLKFHAVSFQQYSRIGNW